MLAHVTTLAASARGFNTADGGVVLVEPGEVLLLDILDHPAHAAWTEAGDVTVAPVPEREARAMRKRLDARVEAEAQMQSEALAALPPAGGIPSPASREKGSAPRT